MQQAGGSQFGVPPTQDTDMAPFTSPAILQIHQESTASPIGSRAGPSATTPRPQSGNFDELVPTVVGNFAEDDVLGGGEGTATGNRWPRQETLALLKIRSEMDAAFRDATLKGPLWDEVSRKLAELGYKRSAKKCKEKFENVHKYYKRTKEGRAGRQDGKSYRFFSQLEALHSSGGIVGSTAIGSSTPVNVVPVSAVSPAPISYSNARMASPISASAPPPLSAAPAPTRLLSELNPNAGGLQAVAAAAVGISFSSNSSSSSESYDEDTEEAIGVESGELGRKRKRADGEGSSGSSTNRKMMAFFERLMKQVMERQEAMQQRFLETIEKREQDRMIREEAWRRQEMARLTREQEMLAQERTMAASRDAALISYLQKIIGGPISLPVVPTPTVVPVTSSAPPPAPAPSTPTPQAQQKPPPAAVQPLQQQPPPPPPSVSHQQVQQIEPQRNLDSVRHQQSTITISDLVSVPEQQDLAGSSGYEGASSSRWPKTEVHALINLRSNLECRYQETGPKGPLWEEISAGMQKLGYNRSAKRCKEKWENINKYFKKVKESNKKRTEDAKTCPYFHQLDALYRQKQLVGAGSGSMVIRQQQDTETNLNSKAQSQIPTTQAQQHQTEAEAKNGNRNGGSSESGGVQVQTSNGGHPQSFFQEGMKKPEDIVKELEQRQQQTGIIEDYDKIDEGDSDNMDQDYSDDDGDDEEDGKMQYKIQFQRPNVSGSGGGNTSTVAAPTASAGSFLAIVQ